MPRLVTNLLSISTIAVLAACSGGGESTPDVDVVPATKVTAIGANPLGLEASFEESTQVITVNGRVYEDFAALTNGRLIARKVIAVPGESRGGFTDIALHGDTSSGGGTVFLVNSTLEEFLADDAFEPVFVEVFREGETSVPTSGSVEYTGSYLGNRYVTDEALDLVHFRDFQILGDVSLTADFNNTGTISGVITNRTGGGEAEWQDLDLEVTAITGGGFSGTTTGGGRIGETTSYGAYAGLLTGPNAGEVVGGLSLIHQDGDMEAGIFVAE